MMADKVLGKINLSKSLERESISVFPNSLKFQKAASSSSSSSSSSSLRLLQSNDFRGHRLVLHNHRDETGISPSQSSSTISQGRVVVGKGKGKGQRWWEKGVEAAANMKEVRSAQELVDCMRAAGDALVVLDFFSPSCGGCKALHPKICQFAEMNPDVQFLQVNYEEHKSMCYSLNVHVLPLFRFYRGPHGRLCSFSCTNATIKKFRDALAKYNPERLSLGVGVGVGVGPAPAKGLEEKELIALAANKDLSFTYTPTPTSTSPDEVEVEVEVVPNPVFQPSQDKTLITSDR